MNQVEAVQAGLAFDKGVPSFIHRKFAYIAFRGVMTHAGSALLLTENTDEWAFPWDPWREVLRSPSLVRLRGRFMRCRGAGSS